MNTINPTQPAPHYNQRQWLVEQRNAGHTPAEISTTLIDNGWDADTAARVSLMSLRSADRQSLTYAALTVSAGLAALGFATSAHLILAGNPDPHYLTFMLSLASVMIPIAVITHVYARRAEERSRFVTWSPARRGWFGTLALCTATVGLVRLLSYVIAVFASITGASDTPLTVASAVQVVTSLVVSVPLFVWSFGHWRHSKVVISSLSDDDR